VPDDVCLVPENRQEVTTEGGLDVVRNVKALRKTVERLSATGIRVSMFIEPVPQQIQAAADLGADAVELHTGAFANALDEFKSDEVTRLEAAARLAHEKGLIVNAGHGINYDNVHLLLRIPFWSEFNVGHSIVARAIFAGLESAVREMLQRLRTG
jgi:pyridoxine 5-phosphate synthase